MTSQTSKTQAYELFNQRASMNRGQARREEERSSTTAVERWEASIDDDGVAAGAKGLLGALTKSFRSMSEDKDEMLVVTMLVTCKGTLDVPSRCGVCEQEGCGGGGGVVPEHVGG